MKLTKINIQIINLIFCFTILILGLIKYQRTGEQALAMIALAFGFFTFSHIAGLVNIRFKLAPFLILTRIIAYLLIIFALIK